MKQKLQLLFLPLLCIAIVFITVYPFICWLLFVHFHRFDIPDDLIDIWLPFSLPWIPILIWLRPRINLLALKKDKRRKNPELGYQMVAAFAVAIPTMVAMQYMHTATGKLTVLQSIDTIDNQKPTKFYEIKDVYIDKANKGIKYTSQVVGRSGSRLDLLIYVAFPIYEKNTTPAFHNEEITKISTKSNYDFQSLQDTLKHLPNEPLLVLDGSIVDRSKIQSLPPDSLAAFQFLKGESAISMYGEKAKNGVLNIISIKNNNVVEPPAEIVLAPAPKA